MNNDFKTCQDVEDMGNIRYLCQNGSRHKKYLGKYLLNNKSYYIFAPFFLPGSGPAGPVSLLLLDEEVGGMGPPCGGRGPEEE